VDRRRPFTVLLVPKPDRSSFPIFCDTPAYIVMEGQDLGFCSGLGMIFARPFIYVARKNLNRNPFAVLRKASMRAALGKAVWDGEGRNKI